MLREQDPLTLTFTVNFSAGTKSKGCQEFIESNYEELTPLEQIDKMRESLREVCLRRQKDKALKKVTAERIEQLSKISDLIVLKIVKETVENADAKFQDWLEANTELFCSVIEKELLGQESKAKSIRWDDLIIRCEWKKEVLDFVDANEMTPSREAVEQATVSMTCQFDTQILSLLANQPRVTQ